MFLISKFSVTICCTVSLFIVSSAISHTLNLQSGHTVICNLFTLVFFVFMTVHFLYCSAHLLTIPWIAVSLRNTQIFHSMFISNISKVSLAFLAISMLIYCSKFHSSISLQHYKWYLLISNSLIMMIPWFSWSLYEFLHITLSASALWKPLHMPMRNSVFIQSAHRLSNSVVWFACKLIIWL